MSVDNIVRANRLKRQLDLILSGKAPLTNGNYTQFLEAIYTQSDPAASLNKLIASPSGLSALQSAMRIDLSATFIEGPATRLLQYIAAPELSSIDGGKFLRRTLLHVVDPPFFWQAYIELFRAGALGRLAQLSLAWLLLQLCSLPGDDAKPYRELAEDTKILDPLVESPDSETRLLGEKIKLIVSSHQTCAVTSNAANGPGGRHDNDKIDFREISILPSADEITSTLAPFLRPSSFLDDPETVDSRASDYLDNLFRLLREDMLSEMREELKIARDQKKRTRRNVHIDGLKLLNVHYDPYVKDDDDTRNDPKPWWWKRPPWSISLALPGPLPQLVRLSNSARQRWLKENQSFLRDRSMGCLLVDNQIVAFVTINRDDNLLLAWPPVVVVQFEGISSTIGALLKLKSSRSIKLVQIDTALFAYEPILKALQEIHTVPLASELLFWNNDSTIRTVERGSLRMLSCLRLDHSTDLQGLLKTHKSIKLDKSQAASLLSGLTQSVSLIQGPPGTGKSFIGALLAKAIHDFDDDTIVVVCYTNHALDQFLEDLLDIGIPQCDLVRLGSKCTDRTRPLTLSSLLKGPQHRPSPAQWRSIDRVKTRLGQLDNHLRQESDQFMESEAGYRSIMDYLEFEAPQYFDAFRIPLSSDGMQMVTRNGKKVGPYYLLHNWKMNYTPGIFANARNVLDAGSIWKMPASARKATFGRWCEEITKEQCLRITDVAKDFDHHLYELGRLNDEGRTALIRSKRIIGCTTTGAAIFREDINAAAPGVLIVEEAGEILESHILTSLGTQAKQLILIGDHKQLRPKVKNYGLTVEKGDGYDLNRSLFERLVLKGYPRETLRQQHRMRPEISQLVRNLTYPDLLDADSTSGRPDLRGVRDNVIWVDHERPENSNYEFVETTNHTTASASKTNLHEASMILKIVRYLGQQGYGTDNIVILTPYLGQLREMQKALKDSTDSVLNDLDSADLVRAGLLDPAAAKISKKGIRLATIDNYQGEESDIIIASLTRSNSDHNIGFMSLPERLNVLLSRARNALIMIGNSDTFRNARKGGEVWTLLFKLLAENHHVYAGFPVRCERHRDQEDILCSPEDFDARVPDGGCAKPCESTLNCGHTCPSRCHPITDHSKMLCIKKQFAQCTNGHQQTWLCHKGRTAVCSMCEKEAAEAERRKEEEFKQQEMRNKEQRKHLKKVQELEAEIARENDILAEAQLAEDRKRALRQKEKDLQDARLRAAEASSRSKSAASDKASVPQPKSLSSGALDQPLRNNSPMAKPEINNLSVTQPPTGGVFFPVSSSEAREDWERQKKTEGQVSDAIDAIMTMTGLENVKRQVLNIKLAVDTAKRQGVNISDRRFNVSMLGNPGTGKTTVARHYARFLASAKILPGNRFIETTGSRLAQDGVTGIKNQIENILATGGGTVFCDEAYQLTSAHNYQGAAVLDFLLAEMENNVGKIVFIFAGYNREMEKFFEHNPGLISRVPYTLQFDDYKDHELMDILDNFLIKRFENRMKVNDVGGIRGLFGRIAVRRLGRGRGRNGFGNARALANLVDKICERQAQRLRKERREGRQPDDFLLVEEDLIGPNPADVIVCSDAYKELQSLIGLQSVKTSVDNLFNMLRTNYDRELLEKEPFQVSLNRVFLGNPGTGKTSVAKIYGLILAELGILSNGEVVVKNPSDFIGAHLGASESQTKAILASTVGKVLVIDEAYMLYGGSGKTGQGTDSYKSAVIDTIVAEVQSVPGEDRCVLLLGYKDKMEEMFQNVNPGLSRRFAIENAFQFDDYDDAQLRQALDLKMKKQHLTATDRAKDVAMDVLSRARNRPNFGNIGEVENLLTMAKNRYTGRQVKLPPGQQSPDAPFEPQDFDPDFERSAKAADNLKKLFEDVVGCEDIVQKLRTIQSVAATTKEMGMDPRETTPTNFLFTGPPGTGKTTTARKIGQVFYDMNFLSSVEVEECSATALIGEYVGHTGPKVRGLLEKSLGRVLFVDEAYRLGQGVFAKEAVDELVAALTEEKFRGKIVVVLAGYDQEINKLLAINPGLSSRFPEKIDFKSIPSDKCLEILKRQLEKNKVRLDTLADTACREYAQLLAMIDELSYLPAWGNARDVQTLAKRMTAIAFTNKASGSTTSPPTLSGDEAVSCLYSMLEERWERTPSSERGPKYPKPQRQGPLHSSSKPRVPPPAPSRSPPLNSSSPPLDSSPVAPLPPGPAAPAPSAPAMSSTRAASSTAASKKSKSSVGKQRSEAKAKTDAKVVPDSKDARDPGVTDEIWQQLAADKAAEEAAFKQSQEAMRALSDELKRVLQKEADADRALAVAREAERRARDAKEKAELQRRLEEARLREERATAERVRIAAAMKAKREEEERKRRQEAEIQEKIRAMGVCVAGFRWIKTSGGYRCAGGSHFLSNNALGI